MESEALPLDRGLLDSRSLLVDAALNLDSSQQHLQSHSTSAAVLLDFLPSRRSPGGLQPITRRTTSCRDPVMASPLLSRDTKDYGLATGHAKASLLSVESFNRSRAPQFPRDTTLDRFKQWGVIVLVNATSGVIAFLLSSTIAVSCASVVVGHGTPLSQYVADFIDMNFLGTAILSIVLAWQSCAPWTLGAIDVFVAPIMAQMAARISEYLDDDMTVVVPTVVVMVSLTSLLLGIVFFLMGVFRVTSIANYMPYPVIAGFLSGVGATLIKNGIHMAASRALSMEFFSLSQQALLIPAVAFAFLARLAQHFKLPVAIAFPALLLVSLAIFHVTATHLGLGMGQLRDRGWVFSWTDQVMRETPMWYSWKKIQWSRVNWYAIFHECLGYLVSLGLLGALKYSVAVISLSTLLARDISPDTEMRVIGLANICSGLFGCCGGCHYLSAIGILQQFGAHEKIPTVLCAALLILLWIQGFRLLQFVPKFIYGGLIISVGVHFLEVYLISPLQFLKWSEKVICISITVSFLCVGMLEGVALGIIISMIELVYRIHDIGCVHHETSGRFSRSAVDRTQEQTEFLDVHGIAIFILRLEGFLFFGTSVNVLERIKMRVNNSSEFAKLKHVIIDFGLVPNFDATALLNFRKLSLFSTVFDMDVHYCGMNQSIERALRMNPPSARVHFVHGDVDLALEICENDLLPPEMVLHPVGNAMEWKQMTAVECWELFLENHKLEDARRLYPVAAFLDVQVVNKGNRLCPSGVLVDTYFICCGYIDVIAAADGKSLSQDLNSLTSGSEESQWTPFTTAPCRLRKIGPGSIITPDLPRESTVLSYQFHRHIAECDCVVLRLSKDSMTRLQETSPQTAIAVLTLINSRLSARFLHSSKRISQLSSLLYRK